MRAIRIALELPVSHAETLISEGLQILSLLALQGEFCEGARLGASRLLPIGTVLKATLTSRPANWLQQSVLLPVDLLLLSGPFTPGFA